MKSDKRSATAAIRRQRSFELRLAGCTYQVIGDQVGISKQAAYGLVRRELVRLNRLTEADGNLLRELELVRLDAMTEVLWSKAIDGDLGAVDRLLRISERRSKLLGLDAATSIAVETPFANVHVLLPNNNRGDN